MSAPNITAQPQAHTLRKQIRDTAFSLKFCQQIENVICWYLKRQSLNTHPDLQHRDSMQLLNSPPQEVISA
eukprot:3123011-Rhodomonas_salina.3